MKTIFNSYKNYIQQDNAKKERAKERLDICLSCSHLINFKICRLCGCFMSVKTFGDETKCMIDKW